MKRKLRSIVRQKAWSENLSEELYDVKKASVSWSLPYRLGNRSLCVQPQLQLQKNKGKTKRERAWIYYYFSIRGYNKGGVMWKRWSAYLANLSIIQLSWHWLRRGVMMNSFIHSLACSASNTILKANKLLHGVILRWWNNSVASLVFLLS